MKTYNGMLLLEENKQLKKELRTLKESTEYKYFKSFIQDFEKTYKKLENPSFTYKINNFYGSIELEGNWPEKCSIVPEYRFYMKNKSGGVIHDQFKIDPYYDDDIIKWLQKSSEKGKIQKGFIDSNDY